MRIVSKELITGGLVSLALKTFAGTIGFIVTVFITRLLGAEDSGLFYLALTIITLLAAMYRLGLEHVATRFVGAYSAEQDWRAVNGLYRASVFFICAIGIPLTLLFVSFADWLASVLFQKPDLGPLLSIMLFAALPFALYWLHAHCFQGLKDMFGFQVFQNLASMLLLLTGIGVYMISFQTLQLDLMVVGKLYLAATLMTLFFAMLRWLRKPWVSFTEAEFDTSKIMRMAIPMYGVTIIGFATTSMSQITLGIAHSAADLGVYNAAFRTAMLISLILMATNSIVLPKYASLFHQNKLSELHRLVILTTRIMIALCIPVLLLMLSYSEKIMSVFGSEFITGAPALVILTVGQFINVATGSVAGLLHMTGNERYSLVVTSITLIVMLILCLTLIPQYGLVGAAIAHAVSISLQMLLFTAAVHRTLGFVPLNIFAKVN